MRRTTTTGRGRRGVGAVLLPVCLGIAGCAPLYVLRAGYEEARILWRRQPIERMLAADPTPAVRDNLLLVLDVREFARRRLGLRVGGSYSSVARVDADQVVHVVTAAPWNRLQPYTWWFPIVGRVPYRGYFDRRRALALAERLRQDGYDTYVRPSVAFSTLGWFDDPLLSNLLRYDRVTLAEIVFHELLHNTIYLPGQAAFNESFASFVGNRAAALFFADRGEEEAEEQSLLRYADKLHFSRFLGALVKRLGRAYRSGITRKERAILLRKERAAFTREPWRTRRYDDFGKQEWNNAILVQEWIYGQRLALFERARTTHGPDLRAVIAWVRDAARNAPDPFAAIQ